MPTLLTPDGQPANKHDRIMLLYLWKEYVASLARTNNEAHSSTIVAGLGKPTFAFAGKNDFQALSNEVQQKLLILLKEYFETSINTVDTMPFATIIERIASIVSPVQIKPIQNYDNPQGNPGFRQRVANVMSDWYETPLEAKHIMFTVGASHSLFLALGLVKSLFPNGTVITPSPCHSLYQSQGNRFHYVDTSKLPGFHLTPSALKASLADYERQQQRAETRSPVAAFLFCSPHNPTGDVLSKQEWLEIAEILEGYQSAMVILDEAYAEMMLNGEKCPSLLTLAPSLKKRLIVIRSGTKGLSQAGNRMACIITQHAPTMKHLVDINTVIACHVPFAIQEAYTKKLESFTEEQHKSVCKHYRSRVELVCRGLKTIGAELRNKDYQVPQATFYVMADLSDLFGIEMPEDLCSTVFGVSGSMVISTDEHIVYYLLVMHGVMLAPLSYLGANPLEGLVRITCSDDDNTLQDMLSRIESALIFARKAKYQTAKNKCLHTLQAMENDNCLTKIDPINIRNWKNALVDQEQRRHGESSDALYYQRLMLTAYDSATNLMSVRIKSKPLSVSPLELGFKSGLPETRSDLIRELILQVTGDESGQVTNSSTLDLDVFKMNILTRMLRNYFQFTLQPEGFRNGLSIDGISEAVDKHLRSRAYKGDITSKEAIRENMERLKPLFDYVGSEMSQLCRDFDSCDGMSPAEMKQQKQLAMIVALIRELAYPNLLLVEHDDRIMLTTPPVQNQRRASLKNPTHCCVPSFVQAAVEYLKKLVAPRHTQRTEENSQLFSTERYMTLEV